MTNARIPGTTARELRIIQLLNRSLYRPFRPIGTITGWLMLTWAVIVVPGFIWNFQTIDAPPTVNAGADQYLVATASPMTLTLNATAADDHGITTYAWTDITVPADKDPATVVTIVSPTTEDTTVTLTNPTGSVTGYYQFTLTVTDTASSDCCGYCSCWCLWHLCRSGHCRSE